MYQLERLIDNNYPYYMFKSGIEGDETNFLNLVYKA